MEVKEGSNLFLDGNPYHYYIFSPICDGCKWYALQYNDDGVPICKAFPEGIPPEVWLGENNHQKSYFGDHGIRFVSKEKEKE